MATLKENTIVEHPETGAPTVLLEGTEVPSWAKGLLGAHLTDAGDDGDAGGDDDAGGDEAPAEGDEATPGAPPKNGSAKAWREYADALGVQTDDAATRDDVIAAVEAAVSPTE